MSSIDQAEVAPARAGVRTRELALHGAIIAAVALGYIVVRIAIAPETGPLRWHATDLFGGIALPSLFTLLFSAHGELGHWARTLGGKLALTAAAVVVWEVVMPILNDRSVADVLDVVAYFVGTLLQHAFVSLVGKSRAKPSCE